MDKNTASNPRATRNALIGTHLLRVRIRRSIFDRLQEVAEELTEESGKTVTVSDLARSALYNYLLIYNKLQDLRDLATLYQSCFEPSDVSPTDDELDEEDEEQTEDDEEGEDDLDATECSDPVVVIDFSPLL